MSITGSAITQTSTLTTDIRTDRLVSYINAESRTKAWTLDQSKSL